jgi:hypothetical protein
MKFDSARYVHPGPNASFSPCDYPNHLHTVHRRRDATGVLISCGPSSKSRGARLPSIGASCVPAVSLLLKGKRHGSHNACHAQSQAPVEFALGHMRSKRCPKCIADDLRPEEQGHWRQHSESSSVTQKQPAMTARPTSKRIAIRLSSTIRINGRRQISPRWPKDVTPPVR